MKMRMASLMLVVLAVASGCDAGRMFLPDGSVHVEPRGIAIQWRTDPASSQVSDTLSGDEVPLLTPSSKTSSLGAFSPDIGDVNALW